MFGPCVNPSMHTFFYFIKRRLSVYIMARILTIYDNQIVTEYLVVIIDYKSGIRDSKLEIITCI